jgi:lysine biosynthesis protein LysW
MAICPECDADIEVDDDDLDEMEVGDPWDCSACGSRLRVAGIDPLEFDADEDDDDDDAEEKAEESDDGDFEDELDDDDDDDVETGDWDD